MEFKDKVRLSALGFALAFSSNFQYGFSSTYLNAPVNEFRKYINESYKERVAFLFCNVVNFFAAIACYLSIIYARPELLIIARLFTAIASSSAYQSLNLFLQECAPTELRGYLSFASEIMFSGTCIVATFLGMNSMWGDNLPMLLAVPILPCALGILILLPMKETPKFLYITKKNKQAAIESIKFYRGFSTSENMTEILEELVRENNLDTCEISFWQVFKIPHLRKAIFLSCMVFQNISGFMTLLLTSTVFLKAANLPDSLAEQCSTGMVICYFIGTNVGAFIIEKFKRRTIFLSFAFLNMAFLLGYVILALLVPMFDSLKYGCLICFQFFGLTYGLGVGCPACCLSFELAPQSQRAVIQSTSLAINSIILIIIGFAVLPLFAQIGPYAFLILYTIPSGISIIILYFQLPETKNRPIHEIVSELIHGKSHTLSNDKVFCPRIS